MSKVTPCIWFDTEAADAAALYTSAFPNSRITETSYYNEAGPKPAGTVLMVAFELDGRPFTALNGGPEFPQTEAVSFQVDCADQAEVDHYWSVLGEGGEESQCGWLKDRFGVSWQVVPRALPRLLQDPETGEKVMRAMLEMKKLDVAALEAAARS